MITSDLDDAVTGEGVAPVFQPIVSLPTRAITIGFEALARWPGQPHLGPQSVFAYAEATHRVTELDRMCIDRAVDGALRGGLPEGALLGVNSEPASDYTEPRRQRNPPARAREVRPRLRTHRAQPASAIFRRCCARSRRCGPTASPSRSTTSVRIPESLALLDIVCPEVSQARHEPDPGSPPTVDIARTAAAIMAHRERHGTLIIAEGIETDQHCDQALAWGANLGQGFLFGRPGPLPLRSNTVAWSPPAVPTSVDGAFGSPFDAVVDDPFVRTGRKRTLLAMSRHLEEQACNSTDTPMVLTALQDGRHFGPATRDRYALLAARCPLVAVFGSNLVANDPPAVRTVELPAGDPLSAQWVVLTLGPHTAAALIARERRGGPTLVEDDRLFDFVVTHDRTVITAAAVALLNRVP